MKRFKLSPEAVRDVREMWAYIAEDSVAAARRVRLQIFHACQRIAGNPGVGHSREDITDKPVLFWPVGAYLIIYNPARKPVEIVRVVHGARDVPSLL
ncbi:MAG TPA: type II toxin-antitoxin system RelE/ParE family toxin [Terriglobia bacterium]|nr:type II toxin-antitoxin system RelE/ParE family toxin [Terriglobia bacterium]